MPNWCMNEIIITGPTSSIKKLRQHAKGPSSVDYHDISEEFPGKTMEEIPVEALEKFYSKPAPYTKDEVEFSFPMLVPVPEDIRSFPFDPLRNKQAREILGKEDNLSGYSFNNLYWGTKWGMRDLNVDVKSTSTGNSKMVVQGNTAWCPPNALIETLSGEYEDLVFECSYQDQNEDYKHTFKCVQGMYEKVSVYAMSEDGDEIGENILEH